MAPERNEVVRGDSHDLQPVPEPPGAATSRAEEDPDSRPHMEMLDKLKDSNVSAWLAFFGAC